MLAKLYSLVLGKVEWFCGKMWCSFVWVIFVCVYNLYMRMSLSLPFYVSAPVEKRYRRHTAFGSVRLWVSGLSLRVPKTLWTPYLKNQWREFSPILVTDVLGFIDVQISFGCQKVKGQGHSNNDPKTLWTPYLTKQWREFHPILATVAPEFVVLISFWVKGQRSRSQEAMTPETGWIQYLRKYSS